ncbi:uncharacterized protein LOC130284324 isoform X2 [Hyla sarda]|uniref:uncharacterized protein LOC130284324 isoform X2 n=1 Tax=Hyla sarda TaxID=327740 RepID=UPI0024C4226B|nr:uncharacterized protein LOC130284324 isoform X2 [Hyla sarda]
MLTLLVAWKNSGYRPRVLQDPHNMDALMVELGRVRLGPVPLPYIFVLVLIPLWTFFSSHENSLLFSMLVIISVIVKGSLLSCWILIRTTSWILQVTLVLCGMIVQMILLETSLHASLFSLIVLVPPSTFTGICIFKLHLWNRGDVKHEDPVPSPRSRQVIGIFSRSSKEEYAWLTSDLKRVGSVVPFLITNSNSRQFSQQVSQCTSAILYHSKTRGRVNITNVTDSLYDKELEYMSRALGKSNVIVVADDMDDSGLAAEQKILTSQPSIAQLSRHLYVFTTKEKNDDQLRKDKMESMYNIISKGSVSGVVSDLVLLFLVVVPWFYFIYNLYHIILLITTNLNGSFLVYYAICSSNHGAPMVGLAAVLVLMVVELSSLYWVTSHMDMVLLIAQSLGTGVFILKMSLP